MPRAGMATFRVLTALGSNVPVLAVCTPREALHKAIVKRIRAQQRAEEEAAMSRKEYCADIVIDFLDGARRLARLKAVSWPRHCHDAPLCAIQVTVVSTLCPVLSTTGS